MRYRRPLEGGEKSSVSAVHVPKLGSSYKYKMTKSNQSLPFSMMLAIGLSYVVPITLRYIPSIPSFFRAFYY
jgi:hypothetical protein